MSKFLGLLVLLFVAGLGVWWIKNSAPGENEKPPTVEETLARERAAAHFADGAYSDARTDMADLAAAPTALASDLARAAAIEFMDGQHAAAKGLLERLEQRAPDDSSLHYISGRMAVGTGDFEKALVHFRAVIEVAPDDLPARLCLANVLDDLDQDEEAKQLYQAIIDGGIEHGGAWYVSAAYRLSRIAVHEDPDEARRLRAIWQQLEERGYKAVTTAQLDRGNFGDVAPPRARENQAPELPGEPLWIRQETLLPELANVHQLFLHDLDGDRSLDIVAGGDQGLFIAIQDDPFRLQQLDSEPVHLVRGIDLGNDDDLDLIVVAAGGMSARLFEQEDEAWSSTRLTLPGLSSRANDMLTVDYDHDGDLDILFACESGATMWRNDGAAEEGGTFTDSTEEAGLATDQRFEWCTIEDVDGDQDVDLLLGSTDGLFLADSLRGGHFRDSTAAFFGTQRALDQRPLLADLDGDARTDLFAGPSGGLWLQGQPKTAHGPGGLQRVESLGTGPPGGPLFEVDIDLDGSTDVLWPGSQSLFEGWLAPGLERRRSVSLGQITDGGVASGSAATGIAIGDIDRDLDVDVILATPAGIEIHTCEGPVGNALGLQFVGLKDNRNATGAVVELRAGPIYRRIYWRGDMQLAGVGEGKWADVVRVTWPNGTIQTDLDVETGYQPLVDGEGFGVQPEGLVGSCPFLYTWNGETFEFISDVLGITPLGLPMAPGQLVPPDHDEYVLVRGDQLVPKDGFFEMHFTEELREVTYLDRVRLDVVDHPAGTSIFPDERFCFPPFPPAHIHTVRGELAATRVVASDGADWTDALARMDDVHAAPFEAQRSQFLGLATPHWIELEFDPETIGQAQKLRLILTGWFYWTDASVNMASARTPGVDFVPPIFQVPADDGSWEAIGPPVGFPAGKTKSMVIDVSEHLDREDPRLRIFSTLRLYWDRIALAVDDDDAELQIHRLEPASATLGYRGFSAAIIPDRPDLPARFDWDRLTGEPSWNPHPGDYTRYGEILPLVEEIDDCFAVLGSGDALALRFDARELPPVPEGFVRDYLVFLDGWAKDRDPNTIQALEVEPLPFHGMSGYPYGEDEAFPDDDLHQRWRDEWQTRPSSALLVPLSPRRELEALPGAREIDKAPFGRAVD